MRSRPLGYFLFPVPCAVAGFVASTLLLARRLPEPGFVVLVSLFLWVGGYAIMGVQSLIFAAAMSWLEQRPRTWRTRYVAASVLGSVLGATLGFVVPPAPMAFALFGLLGASAGAAAAMLVDSTAYPPEAKPRRVVARLLLAIVIPCVGGAAGRLAQEWWIDAARARVLADVSVGMTYDEVARAAGDPSVDSRKTPFARPTESADVVWIYERGDPGGADGLQVLVSFKNEKVVAIRRAPVRRD